VGITQIKHIMGMYEIWDRLLERHPDLVIDNCSSGGKRIDIETMKRSIPFFRSDYQCNFNENPEVLQTHNSNSSVYIPSMGCTSKTKSDTYAARSSFSTSWGGAFYNREFQSMDEADFAWAKKTVDEYKRIRRYFSKDFYNHASAVFDPTAWVVWQYHDAEANRGILMAFRRERSPFSSVEITLKGIDENSRLEFLNLDTSATCNGSRDLTLSLPEKRTSVVVEYSVMS
jgi:alpha-galactosidase